jgi:uncharacterized protein
VRCVRGALRGKILAIRARMRQHLCRMIMDIHVHYPFGSYRDLDRVDRVMEIARRFDIGGLCLLGDVLRHGHYPTEDQIREINDLTITLVRRHPDYLYGFCFLNPANDTEFCLTEMERCIVGEGFKGIKLEISLNCRSRRLDPIMRKSLEMGCLVLHHSWHYAWMSEAQPDASFPADIADLASRFPGVRIIMAHLSGCGMRGVLDVLPHKNVYVDTSGGQPVSGLVEYAVAKLGASRILYGSDVPGRSFAAQLGRIYGAAISKREKAMILGGNAQRLLGLSGSHCGRGTT